ncbi:DUF885 domain-containing protein [Alteromonas sp. a30]|uniref:DUF885 domain-containing protein n=1 Tax=Alteromonas sp. a30 TaxID=2730917 RepID=UPI00227F605A|nr:DUF885 domain-containing protein [Alteromonas sp. a30]MCY7294965.1 DUF885 domain-containing protein [Alteromonas sp. a30]
MKKSLLGMCITAALLSGCNSTSSNTQTTRTENAQAQPEEAVLNSSSKAAASDALARLADAYAEETLKRNPLNAMFFGDNRFNHTWPNSIAPSFIQEGIALDTAYLAKLEAIDASQLTGQDFYTYEIFKMNLKNGLEGAQFPSELLPISQFVFSPHNVFIQLGSGLSAQPFNNAKDFENLIKRGEGFAVWMEQAIINMRNGIERGVVLPKPVVESIIPQLEAQIFDNPSDSSLMTPLNNAGDKLSEAELRQLKQEYLQLIDAKITPIFKKMLAFMQNEYLPHARNTHGYGQLPNGKKWYEYQIKTNTTLPLTADEIHQTGLNEVKRIHNEMRDIMKEVGFKGDLNAFFNFLKNDPQFYFDSPDDVLKAYEDIKAEMATKVPALFDVIPKADYIVRSYPEAQAKSAPGASYIPGAPDGSRPGIFFANTYNLKAQPKYGVETLSIHEAVPGHHFQLSLQTELDELPMLRRMNFYTVYAEGWALYAESLGKELGMFTDPYQYFGKLSAELFRAMRLVVDTGIHAKGWTREQAIEYMLSNSDMVESDITSEVERYMVMPGQATSYKTGQIKIKQLREYAEKALGDKFDIKTFHNLVLLDGSLPMPLLEHKIREWVKSA